MLLKKLIIFWGYFGLLLADPSGVYFGDDTNIHVLSNADIGNIEGVASTAIGDPMDPILRGEMIGAIEDQIQVPSSHTGGLWNINVLNEALTRIVDLKAAA